LAKTENW
jgi:hypothetical protein